MSFSNRSGVLMYEPHTCWYIVRRDGGEICTACRKHEHDSLFIHLTNGNYLKDTEGCTKVIRDGITFRAFRSFREVPLTVNVLSGLRVSYQALL
jgi:hypothetical protein